MNAEDWKQFCNVFNLDVVVQVKKEVTRHDILQTLVREGEFIFKGKNGSWTQMNLSNIYKKCDDEQIKSFKEVLWNNVENFMRRKD